MTDIIILGGCIIGRTAGRFSHLHLLARTQIGSQIIIGKRSKVMDGLVEKLFRFIVCPYIWSLSIEKNMIPLVKHAVTSFVKIHGIFKQVIMPEGLV